MTVTFHTLGCKLNFSETATLARLLVNHGYQKVDFDAPADIVVINSCTVTEHADKKCRQIISKAVKISPEAKVVIVGCLAELSREKILKLPNVALVLGNKDKFNILQELRSLFGENVQTEPASDAYNNFHSSYSLHDRTRAFLKVQDGCDYKCSYCTIPLARGKSRNAPIASIVEQARIIAANKIPEIVLTGVNIGDFGHSSGETFLGLLQALSAIPDIPRIRIGSIEPNLITDEILSLIAQSKNIAPHIHIPLQSGSDKILGAMSRRYKRQLFAERLARIKEFLPQAAIGSDVIVGFPDESESDFHDTYDFIASQPISYLHVFPYSQRPNTRAAVMPNQVSPQAKAARVQQLIALSDKLRLNFYQQNLNSLRPVIFEDREINGLMFGFTDNYIKVQAPFEPSLLARPIDVRLSKILEDNTLACSFE